MSLIDRTRIRALMFDFDGVLTDNKVYVGQNGEEMVRCNRSDGLAFDALRRIGVPVYIVSREVNKVVAARGAKLQVPVVQAVEDKVEAVSTLAKSNGFTLSDILFVGNDVNDLDVMTACGTSACPVDSHPKIREIATFVLEARGGEGVAREVAERLLGIDVAEVLRRPRSKS
jgi:YrbI family 3-deoxy-D-manno-octulosonate 8-phosphate phosphatase